MKISDTPDGYTISFWHGTLTPNEWYHFVVVFDRNADATIYVERIDRD